MSHINTSITDGVLAIRIDRLDKKNALTLQMYTDMTAALLIAQENAEIKVVTLSGGPDCFSAGNDLMDFLTAGALNTSHPVVRFLTVLAEFEKPIIAGVAGYAVGVGTTMLLHCDMIYATSDATFQLPFSHLGLCAEGASSLLLPNVVGYQKAAELLMFGEPFNGVEAKEWGMVNALIDEQPIDQYIDVRAAKLAKLPIESSLATKKLMKNAQGNVMSTLQEEVASFEKLLHSESCQSIIRNMVKGG